MNRKPKRKAIQVRVPDWLYEMISKSSKENYRSDSSTVLMMLEKYVKLTKITHNDKTPL